MAKMETTTTHGGSKRGPSPPRSNGKKARHDRDAAAATQQSRAAALFPTVLRLLVQTGFVGASDLETLCRTSSTDPSSPRSWIKSAALDDDVWSELCHRNWPSTSNLPRALVEAKGYRFLCQRRSADVAYALSLSGTLPPPKVSSEDLVLLVDVVSGGAGGGSFSRAIDGEDLKLFLKDGSLDLSFTDTPVPLRSFGTLRLMDDGNIDLDQRRGSQFRVSMDILRRTDNRICPIFRTSEIEWTMLSGRNSGRMPVEGNNVPKAELKFCEGWREVALKPESNLLKRMGAEGLCFELTTKIPLPFSPRHRGLADTLASFRSSGEDQPFQFFQEQYWKDGRANPNLSRLFEQAERDIGSGAIDGLALTQIKIKAMKHERPFLPIFKDLFSIRQIESDSDSEDRGVTLLHLLDDLQGWNDSDEPKPC